MNTTTILWIAYLTVALASLGLGGWCNWTAKHMLGKYDLKHNGAVEDEKKEITFQRFSKWTNRLTVAGAVMLMGGLFYAMGKWSVLITGGLVALGLYVLCKYYRSRP